MNADLWMPGASRTALELRARLNATLRQHFAQRAVLEVETPILSAGATTDPHIESFQVSFEGPVAGGLRERWLRTSPEFALKRLLAAGVGDCYELGRVFRNGEAGARHNPEFTLLEWYRLGWDHHRLMDEVAELVVLALALVGGTPRIEKISYRELFRQRLGLDPLQAPIGELREPLLDIRIDPHGLERDGWLDLLLTHRLQPQFARNTLLFVYDYPGSQSALARIRGEGSEALAERFEAFLGPNELANGYHELTDADEQAQRFARDLAWRGARGRVQPPSDQRLIAAMRDGLPACAGVALGVDRLLAAMLGCERLDEVLAFSMPRA